MQTRCLFSPYLAILGMLVAVTVQATAIDELRVADVSPASGPRVVWQGHHALLAFYDVQGILTILNPQFPDIRHKISSEGSPQVTNSLIDISCSHDDVYVIWRPWVAQGEHKGERIILFSESRDGGAKFSPPTAVSSGGGAFHPPPLVQGGTGQLYLVWAEERSRQEGIYFNRSLDGGGTWLKHEERVDLPDKPASDASVAAERPAINTRAASFPYDPFIAAEGLRVWLGWAEAPTVGGTTHHVLKLRTSRDGGETWSGAKPIPVPEARVYNMTLLTTPDGLVLFYFAPRAGIQIISSSDGGATWGKPKRLGGTLEVGGQRFRTVHNSRGTLCLTWEGPNSLHGKKADIFVSCSHDYGKSWPKLPTRLDTNEPWLTHSLSPHMAMDEQDNVVVTWQDSRHVRPNIYINYSRDGGKEWSSEDVRLDPEAGRFQSTYPSVASAGDGRFLVTWRTKMTDGPEKSYRLGYAAFSLPGVLSTDKLFPVLKTTHEPLLTSVKKIRRQVQLVHRAKEYWQALIDANYGKAFGLMDPFYRAYSNMMVFGAPLSRVHYLKCKIVEDSIEVHGNIATLKVKTTMEAPNLMIQGKNMSIPKHESELSEKWLWVDGDWYRIFEREHSNMLPL
jgi:photosystem II stability/assembly factor-like uncharacterized protein